MDLACQIPGVWALDPEIQFWLLFNKKMDLLFRDFSENLGSFKHFVLIIHKKHKIKNPGCLYILNIYVTKVGTLNFLK
jgi:hypothetical protein